MMMLLMLVTVDYDDDLMIYYYDADDDYSIVEQLMFGLQMLVWQCMAENLFAVQI